MNAEKSLLRFITCGSVDDGKSTLIGRLLYETKALFEDQLAAVTVDSKRWGTQGDAVDLALLVDGLSAEREQGITIDVAYRYFSTRRRKFIVADTPGHQQYTRNMVTGASTADVAVIVLDARRGVLEQSRRHSYLCSLMGMKHVAVVVNKMDLVDGSRAVFDDIVADYRALAGRLGLTSVIPIPISALRGDNVVEPSAHMPWYDGPTLLQYLEAAPSGEESAAPFRLPVQWVNRPNQDFRGYSGNVASGRVRPGDRVRVQPSGRESTVERVITARGDAPVAVPGQAVTLTLRDEIDISRGDVLSMADAPAEVADQFQATVVWMSDAPLLPGRPYLLRIGAQTVSATVTDLKHKVSVDTLEHLAATTLGLNDIGVCTLSLDRPIAFDAYTTLRATGGFILSDRGAHATCAAGMLHFALRRAHNLHLQTVDVDKDARAALKVQRPTALWFTGLSGAGKSTIANAVEKKLFAAGRHTYLLDGDNVRHGLNRDLGFTEADRVENIRRAAEVARLMVDAGLIVLAAFISPFRADRAMARSLFAPGEFVEIHVDTPLEVAEQRDVKGLYQKARRGALANFTGIDSPYEAPTSAEIVVGTVARTPEQVADDIIEQLVALGRLAPPA